MDPRYDSRKPLVTVMLGDVTLFYSVSVTTMNGLTCVCCFLKYSR